MQVIFPWLTRWKPSVIVVVGVGLALAMAPSPAWNGERAPQHGSLGMDVLAFYCTWPLGPLNLLGELLVCAVAACLLSASGWFWTRTGLPTRLVMCAIVLGAVAAIGTDILVAVAQFVKYLGLLLLFTCVLEARRPPS